MTKVKDIMTPSVRTCQPDTDLAKVASLMWDHDFGFVPVVNAAGRVAGVITDRDICIAAATRGLSPDRISAAQTMSAVVYACMPDDPILSALAVMKNHQVRRLPVIDDTGSLKGVVSMSDIARVTVRHRAIPAKEVVSALAAVSESRRIAAA